MFYKVTHLLVIAAFLRFNSHTMKFDMYNPVMFVTYDWETITTNSKTVHQPKRSPLSINRDSPFSLPQAPGKLVKSCLWDLPNSDISYKGNPKICGILGLACSTWHNAFRIHHSFIYQYFLPHFT